MERLNETGELRKMLKSFKVTDSSLWLQIFYGSLTDSVCIHFSLPEKFSPHSVSTRWRRAKSAAVTTCSLVHRAAAQRSRFIAITSRPSSSHSSAWIAMRLAWWGALIAHSCSSERLRPHQTMMHLRAPPQLPPQFVLFIDFRTFSNAAFMLISPCGEQ